MILTTMRPMSSMYMTIFLSCLLLLHSLPNISAHLDTNMIQQYHRYEQLITNDPTPLSKAANTMIRRGSSIHVVIKNIRHGGGRSIGNIPRNERKQVVPATYEKAIKDTADTIPPGTSDHISQVINLIKTIIGAGVLGIPAGMAASFAITTTTTTTSAAAQVLVPSIILLIAIGLLAANGFNNIGNICRITHSTSYAQAWNSTVSSQTVLLPNIACIMVTFCTLLTYSMVLADTIPSLLKSLLSANSVITPYVTRNNILLLLTTTILLPLCLIQSLKALAPFSLLGICGMVYTAIIMALRYFDSSYSTMARGGTVGKFISTIEPKFRPNFDATTSSTGSTTSSVGGNAAILISMLSTAYMAHYNAPKFYWELKDRNAKRYSAVVFQSFIGAIILMIIISTMGYLTFGSNSQSLILNNYSSSDTLMLLSRWAVVVSLTFSYPLAFVGVRDGIYNVFHISNRTQRTNQVATIILLSIITILASILKDIRVILSLGGATFGNLLSYVFPAFMVVGLAKKQQEKKSGKYKSISSDEDLTFPSPNQVRFAVLTAVLGVGMGIVGTMKAIQAM